MNVNVYLKSGIRKMWWRIIPVVFIFYVISFLDRTNIGFAIPNIETSLHVSAAVLGLASGIFFIGYFIFEVPGTYYVEKIGAKTIIGIFLGGWGVFAALVGISSNALELYFFRFMLGFMEGAFFPGVIYYLSLWFPLKHRATATALFLLAIPTSEIIGAPLASYLIVTFGWRYLFFVEGGLAIIAAAFVPFVLTNRINDAKWLTREEKAALLDEFNREMEEKKKIVKPTIFSALTNKRTILLILTYFFLLIGVYAIAIWVPDILFLATKSGIVHTSYLVSLLWVVILISMIFNGWHSDRTMERYYHTIIPFILGVIGSIIALTLIHSFIGLYIGLIIIGIGTQAGVAPFWTYPTRYLSSGMAAAAIGLINAFGGLGGFVGPYFIGYVESATKSFALGYMLVLVSFILAIVTLSLLVHLDKKESIIQR